MPKSSTELVPRSAETLTEEMADVAKRIPVDGFNLLELQRKKTTFPTPASLMEMR